MEFFPNGQNFILTVYFSMEFCILLFNMESLFSILAKEVYLL